MHKLVTTGCIKTGCQSSPAYKSWFCTKHTSFTSDPGHSLTHEPDDKSEVSRLTSIVKREEEIIHMLLERKCTHSQTYYIPPYINLKRK